MTGKTYKGEVMNRRHLLATIPALALAACGTVTTSKTGTTGTVTIETAKLAQWANAISDAALAILGALQAEVKASPQVAAVEAQAASILKLVDADVNAIAKATAGQQELTFDPKSVPTVISTLLADARELISDVSVAGLPPAVAKKVEPYLAIVQVTIAAIEGALAAVG